MWVCDVTGSVYCVSVSLWVRGKWTVFRAFPSNNFGPILISLRVQSDRACRPRGYVRAGGKGKSNCTIFSSAVAWTCAWALVWRLVLFISKGDIQDELLIFILRIAERSTWRWVVRSFILFYSTRSPPFISLPLQFWSTSIVDICVQLLAFFCLRESKSPFSSSSFATLSLRI